MHMHGSNPGPHDCDSLSPNCDKNTRDDGSVVVGKILDENQYNFGYDA
jgi:hypothetical protein